MSAALQWRHDELVVRGIGDLLDASHHKALLHISERLSRKDVINKRRFAGPMPGGIEHGGTIEGIQRLCCLSSIQPAAPN